MVPLSEYYCLAKGLQAHAAPGGGVYLVSERGSQHAESRLVAAVVTVADGTRDAQAVMAALPDFSPAEVIFALNRLRAQGVLACHPEAVQPGPQAGPLYARIGAVRVVSDTQAAVTTMRAALRGVDAVAGGPELVLCSDYLGPLMAGAAARGGRWMPVKLIGQRSYFGPVFGADQEICLTCLQRRLRLNRPVETYLNGVSGTGMGQSNPARPGLAETAGATAAEVAKMLAEGAERLPGIIEFGPQGRQDHAFVCHCNPVEVAPPDLCDTSPISRRLGGYRSREAGDVVAMLTPLISDLTGVISSAGALDIYDAEGEIARHVWAASYPIVPRAAAPEPDAFHGVALGKGLSAGQAQASALCEAVERMSAQFPAGLEPRRASYEALGEAVVHPNAVWQFSAAQFRDRDRWNALSRDERRHVPGPLVPNQQSCWLPVWSVTEGRQKWMARDLCYANAPEPRYGRFDPNGCAAGSTRAEAVVQAVLELVERDSIAIWWYNRLSRPALDPMAAEDARVRALVQGFVDQGWECWLLDLTGDLAIPCLAAVARAKSDGRWCIGFGCHFDGAIAIERALTELAQLFRSDGRDGPPPWEPMAGAEEAFLYPEGAATLADAPTDDVQTLGGLIDWTAAQLDARGIELLVLDQSRRDTGLAVVKVFAPGLRHFWPRFGPGRLYDVPVQMGWREAPLSEGDLNQTHLFL